MYQSAPGLRRYQPVLDLIGQLSAEQSKLALAIYRGIADKGFVSLSELSAAGGDPEADIAHYLDTASGVYRDDQNHVVGFWGLTAAAVSKHRIRYEEKTRYAWCAWDTLFLPELLNTGITVHSVCAQTNTPLFLEVSPTAIVSASNPDIVVSMLVPDASAFTKDVIGSFCHHIHFFETREAGERWTQKRQGIGLLSLQEAFDLGKMKNAHQFDFGVPAER